MLILIGIIATCFVTLILAELYLFRTFNAVYYNRGPIVCKGLITSQLNQANIQKNIEGLANDYISVKRFKQDVIFLRISSLVDFLPTRKFFLMIRMSIALSKNGETTYISYSSRIPIFEYCLVILMAIFAVISFASRNYLLFFLFAVIFVYGLHTLQYYTKTVTNSVMKTLQIRLQIQSKQLKNR